MRYTYQWKNRIELLVVDYRDGDKIPFPLRNNSTILNFFQCTTSTVLRHNQRLKRIHVLITFYCYSIM